MHVSESANMPNQQECRTYKWEKSKRGCDYQKTRSRLVTTQTGKLSKSPEEFIKYVFIDGIPKVSGSGILGWSNRICIFKHNMLWVILIS